MDQATRVLGNVGLALIPRSNGYLRENKIARNDAGAITRIHKIRPPIRAPGEWVKRFVKKDGGDKANGAYENPLERHMRETL